MTGQRNWMLLVPLALVAAAVLAALMAGAHAIGKWRQRRVWLKERTS